MKKKQVSKEHILAEIKRTAEENDGHALGRKAFSTASGITEYSWKGVYWLNWSDALLEAGFIPNIYGLTLNDDYLIQELIATIRELKKWPTTAELRMRSLQRKSA